MSGNELLLPTVTDIDGTEVVRAIRSNGQVVQIRVSALLGDGSTPGAFSTLTTTGSVGIANSSPQAVLHVGAGTGNPTVRIDGGTGSGGGGTFTTYSGATNHTYFGNKSAVVGGTFDGSAFLGSASGDLIFAKGSYAEGARLTATGNFGIGTDAPYYKLSVNGAINAYAGAADLGRIWLGDPAAPAGYVGMYRSAIGAAGAASGGHALNFASLTGYTFNVTNGAGTAHGSQTEALRITGAGHVVITAGLADAADDAAAAAAGVPVSGLYRTGSVVKFRVS